jgi:hypothetical protein
VYAYTSRSIDGLKVGWAIPAVGNFGGAGGGITGPGHLDRYAVQGYGNILGHARLASQEIYLHDDSFVTQSAYEYQENGHKQLTREHHVTNEGEFITDYKYASDYPGGTDPALDELVTRQVANALIETVTFRADGLVISAQRNQYAMYDGKARPALVETASIEEPFPAQAPFFDAVAGLYEPRHMFQAYDHNGNLLEQSQPDGMITCYIWDSVGTQLLAKIDNSMRNQVFYENFENVLDGTTTQQAYTGTRAKLMAGAYSLDPSQLPQLAGDYTFSYWQKTGQNPWTRVEKHIVGYVPGTQIATDPIDGYLDEVRLYPAAAHMTTFTHQPLQGLQALSDLNDSPTFYEYDEFGRLSLILDHDRHVRTHYEYAFAETNGANLSQPGHVRTYTVLHGDLTTPEEVTNADHHAVALAVAYLDGFARTIQTVRWRGSPDARDVVQIVEYDQSSRKAIRYLPFTTDDGSAAFKTPTRDLLFAFYASNDDTVAKTGAPYALTRFDESPLDRMVEQGAPGEAWQPQQVPADSHTQRFFYRANAAADEILHWQVNPDGVAADELYPPGELRVENTIDEANIEHTVFYDRQGREVLRQTRARNGEELRTYFVYDHKITWSASYHPEPSSNCLANPGLCHLRSLTPAPLRPSAIVTIMIIGIAL